MERYGTLDWISWALATVGALNWGLRGLFQFNLVNSLFGRVPFLERTVYTLVGISGAISLVRYFQYNSQKGPIEQLHINR